MDSNPIHHPSPANKMKCFFLDYVHYWWSAGLVNGLKPHLPPLSSQKNEMPIFWLCSSSDDWPGWSMDLKKNEMLIFGLCSLLMICLADWWTWTPSATPLLPKKWNAQFSITFNFWWSAGLVDGLKPYLPPLSSQKHEMLIFILHLISDVGQTCQWTRTPSTTHLQPIKWNAHFWITLNVWWLAGLVNGLQPHLPPLSSH